jgi:hypothetical protein
LLGEAAEIGLRLAASSAEFQAERLLDFLRGPERAGALVGDPQRLFPFRNRARSLFSEPPIIG